MLAQKYWSGTFPDLIVAVRLSSLAGKADVGRIGPGHGPGYGPGYRPGHLPHAALFIAQSRSGINDQSAYTSGKPMHTTDHFVLEQQSIYANNSAHRWRIQRARPLGAA